MWQYIVKHVNMQGFIQDFELGTRLLSNTCDKTLITILNFKISWGGIVAGGRKFQPPPSLPHYETLTCMYV